MSLRNFSFQTMKKKKKKREKTHKPTIEFATHKVIVIEFKLSINVAWIGF